MVCCMLTCNTFGTAAHSGENSRMFGEKSSVFGEKSGVFGEKSGVLRLITAGAFSRPSAWIYAGDLRLKKNRDRSDRTDIEQSRRLEKTRFQSGEKSGGFGEKS